MTETTTTRTVHPALVSRHERAVALLRDGKVRRPRPGDYYDTGYFVAASQPRHWWHLERYDGELACGCYDFVHGHAPNIRGQRYCKHVIAVVLFERETIA